MTTSVFFNNFESYAEKDLIENLVIESIRMYGHDLYYCPRTVVSEDSVFNEDSVSSYDDAYLIEMYIKNVEGFEGEGYLLSKFNVQVRDEITFTVAQRVFHDDIGATEVITRPREGDLIYLPLTQKVYVVKFVDREEIFYQMGGLQTYALKCEMFEYSNENLNTGVPEIDKLEEKYSISVGVNDLASYDEDGNIIIDANTGRPLNVSNTYSLESEIDPFADNESLQSEGSAIIDFSEIDPFSEGNI